MSSSSPITSANIGPVSSSPQDPAIPSILDFWFSEPDAPQKWFSSSPEVDSHVAATYGHLVTSLRAEPAVTTHPWTQTPSGTLALLLLLDQFPRNMYRGGPEAFALDGKALEVAVRAVARGDDVAAEVAPLRSLFFYLPFMHSEDLLAQVAGVALYDRLVNRCEKDSEEEKFGMNSKTYGIGHLRTIEKFGRFPSRNKALGRESSIEEKVFLEDHPGGFY